MAAVRADRPLATTSGNILIPETRSLVRQDPPATPKPVLAPATVREVHRQAIHQLQVTTNVIEKTERVPSAALQTAGRVVSQPQPFGAQVEARRVGRTPAPAAAYAKTEPSIHIHIGRVDVRAVTQPVPLQPAKRSDPARPKSPSLDEYLRRHNGNRA
jgi:hypothetical protein